MRTGPFRFVYGPVPSRRLGRSLGVDLVPFKTCTYDCIYCQLGRTTSKTLERREYIPVGEILAELQAKLAREPAPDYISLAGSGEPTLHSGIGELLREIKKRTGIPIAVLTNGSLLWNEELRRELEPANLVLPSLDAGDPEMFRRVNRPCEGIGFEKMAGGLAEFTAGFPGDVWLEILLVAGLTDREEEAAKIAARVGKIGPERVQLTTVLRPPAENFAGRVPWDRMKKLASLFPEPVDLVGDEVPPERFPFAKEEGDDEEIVSLLRRRPCTFYDVVQAVRIPPNEALKRLNGLLRSGRVTTASLDGWMYYHSEEQRGGG